jgi:hypothetical protein
MVSAPITATPWPEGRIPAAVKVMYRWLPLSKMSAKRRCVSYGVFLVSVEAAATVGRGQRRHRVVVAHHHRVGKLAAQPVNLDPVRDGLKAAHPFLLVTSERRSRGW